MCFETTILEITVVVFAYSFSSNAFFQDHPQHLLIFFQKVWFATLPNKVPWKMPKEHVSLISAKWKSLKLCNPDIVMKFEEEYYRRMDQ